MPVFTFSLTSPFSDDTVSWVGSPDRDFSVHFSNSDVARDVVDALKLSAKVCDGLLIHEECIYLHPCLIKITTESKPDSILMFGCIIDIPLLTPISASTSLFNNLATPFLGTFLQVP